MVEQTRVSSGMLPIQGMSSVSSFIALQTIYNGNVRPEACALLSCLNVCQNIPHSCSTETWDLSVDYSMLGFNTEQASQRGPSTAGKANINKVCELMDRSQRTA